MTGKIVEPTKKIGVDLLQSFHRADFDAVDERTFKQSIRFLLAFAVDGFVAVSEPLDKAVRLAGRKYFGKRNDPLMIENIGVAFLTIGSCQFQLGSDTTQFIPFFLQLGFQVFPVVAIFLVVRLIVKNTYNIQYRKIPLGMFVIPDCPHLTVIKKTDGDFTHDFLSLRPRRAPTPLLFLDS